MLGDDRGRLAAADRVHHVQPFERVAAVQQRAFIQRREIVLGVVARQRRPAEQHRDGQPLGVQLFEIFLHHRDGLHEQPAHADRVGLVLFAGAEDVVDRLLDAEVVNGVTVVREDDVDEVLADVVYVAAHRRQHDLPFTLSLGLLHVRLEVRDGRLHRLGGLQHERELHLP